MLPEITPHIIKTVIRSIPQIIPKLTPATWQAFKAAPGYEGVRNTYWAIVYDAVYDYLTGDRPVTSFANAMKRGMVEAFGQASDIGYEAGGGELPLDEDTLAWFNAEVDAELGHIDDLFARLKVEWDGIDPVHEAFARADGYAGKLDAIYGEAKMRGSKNISVTWELGQTEKHCPTCSSLNGKRHRLSWFIDRDYIPHNPGAAMECGGYNCDCRLVDKDGNEYNV